jgi:hypothetical protein
LKDEKSTNILACQEALIDNDLKDFAEMWSTSPHEPYFVWYNIPIIW